MAFADFDVAYSQFREVASRRDALQKELDDLQAREKWLLDQIAQSDALIVPLQSDMQTHIDAVMPALASAVADLAIVKVNIG